ncbi:matrixin family metalloprotease [Tundrisphaera lichenicola]|uniref:matrixin family metalloprotease n=1 Tax=Tundrisphaera lichenicola TaxID=2029860 RepID=UPI003EB77F27
MICIQARRRAPHHSVHHRAICPALEPLESRFLLYATTGGFFSQPERITYSFVPDGTIIGGIPSNLIQTMNSRFEMTAWQQQFAKAAASWQKVAHINLVQVPDGGQPIGIKGNQQGDLRFGDIRIGGYFQPSNQLAFAYLPPPFNGGTAAGDIFFNTSQSWQINGKTYDLMSVALHEFGHSLGLDHSRTTSAVMWPSYTGAKQVLNTDDINGIRSIYNSRQYDYFDANGGNNQAKQADDLTSWINTAGMLSLSGLDSTTPVMIGQGADVDWYKIKVPATSTGTMIVKMQSEGLSLLSPSLSVYNSSGTTILGQSESTRYGDTVSVTIKGVIPGQVYEFKAKGSTTGDSGYGSYGLQVNFTSKYQAPIAIPNTMVSEQTNRGSGTLREDIEILEVGTYAKDAGIRSAGGGDIRADLEDGGSLTDQPGQGYFDTNFMDPATTSTFPVSPDGIKSNPGTDVIVIRQKSGGSSESGGCFEKKQTNRMIFYPRLSWRSIPSWNIPIPKNVNIPLRFGGDTTRASTTLTPPEKAHKQSSTDSDLCFALDHSLERWRD